MNAAIKSDADWIAEKAADPNIAMDINTAHRDVEDATCSNSMTRWKTIVAARARQESYALMAM